MTLPGLPPPRPIPLKDRASLVFVERAQRRLRLVDAVPRVKLKPLQNDPAHAPDSSDRG